MTDIAVVDYGMGNLRSVSKALEHVAPELTVTVTGDARVIARAGRVVFPGVGAMPDCMRELAARGLRETVIEAARHRPFLGICLGMQALFEHSEEGDADGLGVLPGRVRRFPAAAMVDERGNRMKVPHMGWNQVAPARSHPLWHGIAPGERFYFVHSYYVEPAEPALVAASTSYPFPFASAVATGSLFAVQFHPEKSQAAGLALLRNFARWDGRVPETAYP
ncbi:MAG: imidazole glycerol phosphate synthase subunit HisH [Betaproteobacteria bacterium]|nr:imidazole glycerol phosphate synthase subunit HisH [Betaproteobacteria bacterium]